MRSETVETSRSNMLLGAESADFLAELENLCGKEEKYEIGIKTSSKHLLRNSFEPAEFHRHLTVKTETKTSPALAENTNPNGLKPEIPKVNGNFSLPKPK